MIADHWRQHTVLYRGALAILLLLSLTGYWILPQASQLQQTSGQAMGTTWSLKWIDGPTQERLQSEVEALLGHINAMASSYDKHSELSRLNRAPLNQWIEIGEPLMRMLQLAQEIHRRSGGSYDISIGPLVNLWGFGPDGSIVNPPRPEALQQAQKRVGMQHLELAGRTAVRKHRNLDLDLSSVAKGYAVDEVAALLEALTVENYLIELGGELRMRGVNARGDPWRIGIESPDTGQLRRVAASLSPGAEGGAVATSGDYQNYFTSGGRHYSHLISPQSGYPVEHAASVTVVHSSCMRADAWATALAVLLPERALAIAESNHLAVYFIWRTAEGGLRRGETSQIAEYLRISGEAGH